MTYKCGFCGKEYENPTDYAVCVNICADKKKREDERIRRENLEKEKGARLEEVRVAQKVFSDLLYKYLKDYGCYESYGCAPAALPIFTF